MVRVSACHAEGREFESRHPRKLKGGIYAAFFYVKKIAVGIIWGRLEQPLRSWNRLWGISHFIVLHKLFKIRDCKENGLYRKPNTVNLTFINIFHQGLSAHA